MKFIAEIVLTIKREIDSDWYELASQADCVEAIRADDGTIDLIQSCIEDGNYQLEVNVVPE
mgnify:CR=1 FL=1